MRLFGFKLLLISALLYIIIPSCINKSGNQERAGKGEMVNDTTEIIKIPFSNNSTKIEYEVTVLKGSKTGHGLWRRFYPHGSVYSDAMYVNGKKHGVKFTYYQEYKGEKPKVWKEQPYKNGKLDGICRRYHRNGRLQAEYEYKNGLPAVGLKEWSESGKEVKYPDLIVSKKEVYHQIHINVQMSDKSKKVVYYSGNLIDGKYVPGNLVPLLTKNSVGEITVPHASDLRSMTVIAVLNTRYKNKNYISKTIQLK